MRDEWYVARRGQGGNTRYGPVPLRQLRELLDEDKVRGEDLVWCEGMANWRRADQCDALFPSEPRPSPRRGPRGYGPDDDDRPYRRRYPPPQSSSGWAVALGVGGAIFAVCVLACAGIGFLGYLGARPSTASFSPALTPPMANVPAPIAPVPPDDGVIFDPGVGAPQNGLGQAIPYGLSELYYTNNVLPTDAQALGDYLQNKGFFPDDHGVTVQLDKNALGTYRARFCLKAGAVFDPVVVAYYRNLRADLAVNVFPLSAVEADLCDVDMNTLNTIRVGD